MPMPTITTERLIFLPIPSKILQLRLERAAFSAEIELPTGLQRVIFPPNWPSEAIVLFRPELEILAHNLEERPWGGMLIESAIWTAVGTMGCKALPDAEGRVEIGYHLIDEARGKGLATEALEAFCTWLFTEQHVREILAEVAYDNHRSQRLLQRFGFARTTTYPVQTPGNEIWAKHR